MPDLVNTHDSPNPWQQPLNVKRFCKVPQQMPNLFARSVFARSSGQIGTVKPDG
jgi:hypothetical protein